MDKIRRIIESHNFDRIIVYCSVPEYLYGEADDDESIFSMLAKDLELWMDKPVRKASNFELIS